METVDVIIASYGDLDYWKPLFLRAAKSVYNQARVPNDVIQVHSTTETDLSVMRNEGAAESIADWLIFLDADDELDRYYVGSMMTAAEESDMRWPSTIGVYENGTVDSVADPHLPKYDFLVSNHMVIGTMVRHDLFEKAGGFRPGLTSLEDWDLWIRCRLVGGYAVSCPSAVYKIHVKEGSRNQNPAEHARNYVDIQQRYQAQWNSLSS